MGNTIKQTALGKGPDAPKKVSNPNKLDDLLKDLESYETVTNTGSDFQSTDGSRGITIDHKVADPLPEIYKNPSGPTSIVGGNIRDNPGENIDKKTHDELEKTRKDAPFAAVTSIPKEAAELFADMEAVYKVASLED